VLSQPFVVPTVHLPHGSSSLQFVVLEVHCPCNSLSQRFIVPAVCCPRHSSSLCHPRCLLSLLSPLFVVPMAGCHHPLSPMFIVPMFRCPPHLLPHPSSLVVRGPGFHRCQHLHIPLRAMARRRGGGAA
jgi:hypothetical protein